MKYIALFFILLFSVPASAEGKPELMLFRSYLATIRNSVGARIFRNIYYRYESGRVKEELENGNLSCAYFVSSTLHHFGLLEEFYLSVTETADAMKKNGWKIIEKPVSGSVIVWDKKYFRHSRKWHGHIGFYIGRGRAISTSSWRGYPVVHSVKSWRRKIVEILWHEKLEQPSEGGAR